MSKPLQIVEEMQPPYIIMANHRSFAELPDTNRAHLSAEAMLRRAITKKRDLITYR